MGADTDTEWHGPSSFNRNGAWAFYVFMNALAIYFNSCLIVAVFRLKDKKTSTDILIASLSSGIVVAAFGCGPQCIFNLIMQNFAFGDKACFFEAFFHIVGMITQFLSVSCIAYRTYVGVVKLQVFTITTAYAFVAAIWCISVSGTLLFGTYSSIYLVASGTFCFYSWTSLALIAWAWPVAGIAAALMAYWYYQTFQVVKHVRRGARDILLEGSKKNADLVIKLSTLVFFFVFGYSGIVCQSFYELFVGRAKIWGDVMAAAIVLIYWVSAPFAYARANHRLGFKSALMASPISLETRSNDKHLVTPGNSKKISGGTKSSPAYSSGSAPETEMSKFSKQVSGVQEVSINDPHARGMHRLEGPPEDSNGGFFSFDGTPRQSAMTMILTEMDSRPSTASQFFHNEQPDSALLLLVRPSLAPEDRRSLSPSTAYEQLNDSGFSTPVAESSVTNTPTPSQNTAGGGGGGGGRGAGGGPESSQNTSSQSKPAAFTFQDADKDYKEVDGTPISYSRQLSQTEAPAPPSPASHVHHIFNPFLSQATASTPSSSQGVAVGEGEKDQNPDQESDLENQENQEKREK